MELRQLRYFLVVAEELHFRRAADRIYMAQPALSRQIAMLEQKMGVQLFDRTRRSVSLTPAGEMLQSQAAALLQQFDELPHKIRMAASGFMGEIKIGYVGSAIQTVLPGLLSQLGRKHPGIQTYLSELPSSVQWEQLHKNQLDIAFMRNPPAHPQVTSMIVWREPFFLVLPKEHRLNARNFHSLQQLSDERFILPPAADGEGYYRHMLALCEESGFTPALAHETTHGHTILKLVESGLGISILPLTFKKIAGDGIRFLKLPQTKRNAELTAVWLQDSKNASLKFITELLKPVLA